MQANKALPCGLSPAVSFAQIAAHRYGWRENPCANLQQSESSHPGFRPATLFTCARRSAPQVPSASKALHSASCRMAQRTARDKGSSCSEHRLAEQGMSPSRSTPPSRRQTGSFATLAGMTCRRATCAFNAERFATRVILRWKSIARSSGRHIRWVTSLLRLPWKPLLPRVFA